MPTAKKPSPKTKKSEPKNKKQRKLEKIQYKSFRLSKRIRHEAPPLPKARHIFTDTVRLLFKHKRLFVGIVLVYLIFGLVFVRGFDVLSSNFSETKSLVSEIFSEESRLLIGTALVGVLFSNASQGSSDVANLYSSILLLVTSLAVIWALRQAHAKKKPKAKDAFYSGMYPLIPYLLVLMMIVVQLLPLIIGNAIYTIVISNGIAVTGFEQALWICLFAASALLSLYMITSSIFALYIVTLPDVEPLQALRSARQLVLHRRLMVVRKVLFLPLALLLIIAVILVPVIIFAATIAEIVFFVLLGFCLVLAHGYYYELYRKLL